MSVKQIKSHVAVLAVTVFAALTVLFALATVTSSAADVIIETDGQGNRTITMSDSTYDQQIILEQGTTTTIKISGDNKLTYGTSSKPEDWCICGEDDERRGNLIITGSGTLETPNSGITCQDFTVNGGVKLKGLYAPNVYGAINVDNADIEAKSNTFFCGDKPSNKNIFNNTRLNIEEGITLYASTVMNDCNVITERKGLDTYGNNLELTINGGTFNFNQDEETPAAAMSVVFRVKAKNTVIKANSLCMIMNLEMSNSTLEITAPEISGGSSSIPPFALYGDNLVFTGSKVNIGGGGLAGIYAIKQLIMTGNTEANIKGKQIGVVSSNVQIKNSKGTFQATDPDQAIAAFAAYNAPTDPSEAPTPGTIKLDSVSVIEPAGGAVGEATVRPATAPEDYKLPITTILDGQTPAKKVVLDVPPAPKPTPTPTPKPTTGEDGTVFGKGASVAAAEAAILALPNDNDPAGTAFGLLQFKASKVTKNSISLKWKAVPGATKYILFANKCGTGNKYKKLGEVTGTSYTATQAAGAAIQKGTYYKFMMIAADSSGKVVSTSKTVHAATKGGKIGNHKKVTVKKAVTKKAKKLKKGKTLKLKAKAVPQAKKLKVRKHRGIMYESSNPAVAQVNGKGAVKGINKGTCYIYAYAQNGTCAKVKVTVK